MLADVIGHFRQRSAGKENLVHAFAFHCRGIVMGDGSAATAKDFDVAAAFAQKSDNFREELDVSAVVTGNPDGAHVLLDGRAHNVADRTVIAEINDLDPVPDELQIDRIDRAVMPVANRDSGENTDR